MKINTELQDSRVIETNITTVLKSHKFSIDNEAAILKNARQSMYKYPIRTLVQEYLSNGRDSCREAKTGFKIDVTLPTSTKLIFKVRDYGVGLSPERVLNVFMKFGKSTKTETDEFTGGFGFGAKSGFAYTDNFTIISTFNGKCYHYSASVDNSPEANDVGSLDLLSVNESSEPNGVEIQIAVAQNDLSAFLQAYYRATFFWKERPNVIGSNGTGDSSLASWYLNPNSILSFENIQLFKSEDLGSLFQNKKKDYNNGLIFVIDGIPYTIEVGDPLNSLESVKSLVSQISDGRCLVVHMNNNDCDPISSREALSNRENNKGKVEKIASSAIIRINQYKNNRYGLSKNLKDYIDTHKVIMNDFTVKEAVEYQDDSEVVFSFKNYNLISDSFKDYGFHIWSTSTQSGKEILEFTETTDLDPINYSIVYLDEEYGPIVMREKMRSIVDRNVIVVFSTLGTKDSNFKKIMTELAAVPVSTLLRKKSPNTVQKKKPDPNKIFIRQFHKDSWTYKVTSKSLELDISELKEDVVYVYVTTLKGNIIERNIVDESDLFSTQDFFNSYGLQTCTIHQSLVEKIKGSSQFIHISDFIANVDKYITDIVNINVKYKIYEGTRTKFKHIFNKELVKTIEDPRLNLQLTSVLKNCDEYKVLLDTKKKVVPSFLVKHFIAKSPELKEIETESQAFIDYVNSSYYLMNCFSYVSESPTFISELINYLNCKYKQGLSHV